MLSISYLNCLQSLSNNGKKTKDFETSTWKPELSKRASRMKKNKAVEEEWEPELSKRCSRRKKND